MLDYSKYYGMRYDIIARDIAKAPVPPIDKADCLVKIGIDLLDEDVRPFARRIFDAADASCVRGESIDLIRAAFASPRAKAAEKRKAGRRIRDVKDIPILQEPIWEALGISK